MITLAWIAEKFPDMLGDVTDRERDVVIELDTYPRNYNLRIIINKRGIK